MKSSKIVIRQYSNYQDHNLSLILGKGRLRNVTGIHKANLLLQRYEEKSDKPPNLDPEQIIHLAQTLESQKKFSRLYYRSGKEFWKIVGETLDSLGLSLDELDLYSTLYLTESTNLLHHPRYVGSRLEIISTLQYEKRNTENSYHDKSDSVLSKNEDWEEDIYLLLKPSYTFYRPLSFRSSINFNAQFQAGPAVNHLSQYQQQYALIFGANHYYDVTDRLMSTLSAYYDNYRYNNNPSQVSYDTIKQNLSLTSSLKFYLIDVAYLEFAYNYNYRAQKYLHRENSPDSSEKYGKLKITPSYEPSSPAIYAWSF